MTAMVTQLPRERVKRWTKREYMDQVERGAFRRPRVYLFRGDLIDMAGQNFPHQWAVTKLNRVLFEAFGSGAEIRIQGPLDIPGDSMLEPDGAVCTSEQMDRRPCPTTALLVVEVSDTSLGDDREKAREYAAARVPEYWIVDVNARQVEVFRDPVADSDAPLDWRYTTHIVVPEAGEIRPIARPDAIVQVARMLPPVEPKSSE